MTKKILLVFSMIIPLFSISQDWTQYYVPYYRNVMEIHAINMHEISTLRGWLCNYSIRVTSFSEGSKETWEFNDIIS